MEFIVLLVIVLLVVLTVGAVYKRCWDKNLHYECKFSVNEAYEGDEIELIETMTNAKLLPLPWAKTEITTSAYLDFAGSQSVVTYKSRFVPSFFMLKSYHRVVRKWKVKCLRRGEFDIERITVVATDPLGRSTYSKPVHSHSPLTVLPRPMEPDSYLLQPSGLTGDIVVPRKLISDPFLVSGVREYTQYDSANRIHWAATAREGRIMVRNNDYTSDQNVTVVLNMQTKANEGSKLDNAELIEYGIVVAATYLDAALPLGIPIRLLANGGMPDGGSLSTGAGVGKEHTLDLMRVLARLEVCKSENLLTYLPHATANVVATDIIIISPYIDSGMCDFARERALQGIHVRFLLTQPQDNEKLPEDCDILTFIVHDREYKQLIETQTAASSL